MMHPQNENNQSASKASSSKMAALTESLAAPGRERQSQIQSQLTSVQETVQNLCDLWKSAGASWTKCVMLNGAEAARSGRLLWRTSLISTAMSAAVLLLLILFGSILYPAVQILPLRQELVGIQSQVEQAKATLQVEQQKLEETRSALRKLAPWIPLSRLHLFPSQNQATTFIRIVPDSIQIFEGATIALPELKQEN